MTSFPCSRQSTYGHYITLHNNSIEFLWCKPVEEFNVFLVEIHPSIHPCCWYDLWTAKPDRYCIVHCFTAELYFIECRPNPDQMIHTSPQLQHVRRGFVLFLFNFHIFVSSLRNNITHFCRSLQISLIGTCLFDIFQKATRGRNCFSRDKPEIHSTDFDYAKQIAPHYAVIRLAWSLSRQQVYSGWTSDWLVCYCWDAP